MIGILFFLFEFYDDQLLAFMVLILVWLCELFTLVRYVSISLYVIRVMKFVEFEFTAVTACLVALLLRNYFWFFNQLGLGCVLKLTLVSSPKSPFYISAITKEPLTGIYMPFN